MNCYSLRAREKFPLKLLKLKISIKRLKEFLNKYHDNHSSWTKRGSFATIFVWYIAMFAIRQGNKILPHFQGYPWKYFFYNTWERNMEPTWTFNESNFIKAPHLKLISNVFFKTFSEYYVGDWGSGVSKFVRVYVSLMLSDCFL